MPGLNYQLIVPPAVEPVSLSLAKKQLRVDIPDDDFLIETYIGIAREYCESFTNRAFFPQTWELYLDNFPYGDYRDTIPLDQRNPWNYSAYWNDFAIRLPKPMLQIVNSINYLDATGTPQVLDPSRYYVDFNSRPARITPPIAGIWPITQFYLPGSISIPFVASSYSQMLTETGTPVEVSSSDYTYNVKNQVIDLVSVVDGAGHAVTYTSALVMDTNGDPTSQTQITLTTVPAGGVITVVYQGSTLPKPIIGAMLLIIGHLYEHREENSELTIKTIPMGVKSLIRRYRYDVLGNYGSGY